MAVPLNILIVEDSPDDAELLVQELRLAGFEPEWKRVETEPDFLAELKNTPDLILSDYTMPQFSGLRAVDCLRERGLDIPFILVSGTVGEEAAVESMKHGAMDYLLKDRIGRLGSAVQRALEQKRLREAHKRMQQQLALQATALETAANAIIVTDRAGKVLWANPAFSAATGYSREEILGKTPRVLKSGKHSEDFYRDFWKTITSGQTWRGEFINRRKDGSLCYDEHTVTPVRAESGEITHFVGIMHDISARRQAEEELRVTHEKLRHLLAHSPAVIYTLNLEGENPTPAIVSDNIERFLGVTVAELSRYEWWLESLHPEDRDRVLEAVTKGLARDGYSLEYRLRHKNGTYLWIEDNNRVVHDAAGKPTEAVGVWTDITDRKRAEEGLHESERRFREMLENVHLIAMTLDSRGVLTFCNDYLLQLTGWKREEVIGQDWFEKFIPETDTKLRKLFFETIGVGKMPVHHENSIKTRHGELREIRWNNTLLRDVAGSYIGTASLGEDITERKRTEAALRESEVRFRQLAENINEVFWITDPVKKQFLYVSPAYEIIWGRFCASLLESPHAWLEAIHPDDRERVHEASLTKEARGDYEETYRIVRLDGSIRWIRDRAFPIRDATGEVYRIVGTAADITGQRNLEQQLRHMQKMESIGQLAAGVAHDFNNILAVIRGNAELALMDADKTSTELIEFLKQITVATERAANLTRQLLLFSHKQVMQERLLALNEVVGNMIKMLKRILGEDIALEVKGGSNLSTVLADVGMMEQVVMNLAVNARDAMPQGGRLVISTSVAQIEESYVQLNPQAVRGDYVCLTVSDTGCGIPPDIQTRIFDPFFTTKGVGKGTGLGLATVYGIVQQHKGWITVYSEAGHGAVFRIYLPVAGTPAKDRVQPEAEVEVRGGNETILLAEDEAAVRALMRNVLERYGYTVIEAGSGVKALNLWNKHHEEIELVLTDMIMPDGMTGRQLAEQIHADKPAVPVIYTSGYSADIVAKDFELKEGSNFLQKPCAPRKLAQAVRRCLDGGSPR